MKNNLLVFAFFLFCLPVHFTQAQDLDSTMWTTDGQVNAIVRSGNTIYLGGDFKYVGPRCKNGVIINQSDGKIAPKPFLNIEGRVNIAIPDEKGGWYIGGDFNKVQGIAREHLAHILPNGHLDIAWNPGADHEIHALCLVNNTVYIGGYFSKAGGQNRNRVAAIHAVTGQVTSWNPGVSANITVVYTLVVSDNTVFVGGAFASIGGQDRNNIAAIDAISGQATLWNPNANQPISTIAVSNNTVYAGGFFNTIGGQIRNRLAAFNITTGLVTTWNPNIDANINAMAVSNNTIYICGPFTSVGGQVRNRLAAIDASTGIATSWNPNSELAVFTLSVSGNTVYAGGEFTSIGGQARTHLAALDATTGEATSWNPGVNDDSRISTLAVFGSAVFVGGEFTSIGSQARRRLAALDATTGQATSWNPGADAKVYAMAINNNTIYAGGEFTSIGSQKRNNIAALDAATGQATLWNPDANALITSLVVANNTVYAGGYFDVIGGQARTHLAAIDASTGLATSWNPNLSANDWISDLTVSNNNVYISGSFTTIGGRDRWHLAAINAATGQVTSWNPALVSFVGFYALAVSNNKVYVGGYSEMIGGLVKNNLIAFDAVTGETTPWNPGADEFVNKIAVSNNTIYVGGPFTKVGGQTRNHLAAIDASTGQTTSWNPSEGSFGDSVTAITVYEDKIYLGGNSAPYFTAFGKETPKTNLIKGNIYEDINGDCVKNPTEKGLENTVVIAQPGNYFGSTDSLGNYILAVDTGSYTIQQVLPTKGILIQQVCPVSPLEHTVRFAQLNETISGKDFGNQITLKSYLTVSVSSTRRRRCFPGNTIVSYQNEGTANADSVKVYVKLPEHVVLVKANAPYKLDKDQNYVFTIGKLVAGGIGSITIVDSVACNNPNIRGLTQCTKAWITPVNQKEIPANWDQSSITLKAACQENGFVRLGIYNTGTGSMADSSAYRILLDAQMAFQSKVKLIKGDSLILRVPVNGKTLRLEVDQRPNHPGKQQSNITLEGCGTNSGGTVSKGFVSQLPTDDEEPEVSVECLPIVDSFDPNDKAVSPKGVGADKFTPTSAELDYTIRFQNTGTDVAYKVVVVDTLSEHLDVSTLQMQSASHAYTVNVSGKGKAVVTWTLDNINLPDSTTNKLGSNGFVHFSIKPKANLPEKTKVENFADIFFDYNLPVRTNTTLNTLYDIPHVVVETVKLDPAVICVATNLTVQAGTSRALCEQDTIILQAKPSLKGLGTWKRISGTGVIQQENNPFSKVTGLGYGENIFEWKVPANSCASDFLQARVTITRNPKPAKPVISLVGPFSLKSSIAGDTYQWYLDGSKLPDNTQSIQVSKQGQYTVQVSSANCSSVLSEVFHFIITSLEAPTAAGWVIYPNPHSGHFSIELPLGLGLVKEIHIVDPLGRNVFSQVIDHSNTTTEEVDFSAYPAGTYFVKIQTEKGSFVKRMVKQ